MASRRATCVRVLRRAAHPVRPQGRRAMAALNRRGDAVEIWRKETRLVAVTRRRFGRFWRLRPAVGSGSPLEDVRLSLSPAGRATVLFSRRGADRLLIRPAAPDRRRAVARTTSAARHPPGGQSVDESRAGGSTSAWQRPQTEPPPQAHSQWSAAGAPRARSPAQAARGRSGRPGRDRGQREGARAARPELVRGRPARVHP
jgi:hypothetical protein